MTAMGNAPHESPDGFMDRAFAAPVLQPLTPVWGRQHSSAAAKPGPAQVFFPKWKQPPSSVFRRPTMGRPPPSAPAHSLFAQRRTGIPFAQRWLHPEPVVSAGGESDDPGSLWTMGHDTIM